MRKVEESTPYEITFYPLDRYEFFQYGLNSERYDHGFFLERLLKIHTIDEAICFLKEANNPSIRCIYNYDPYTHTCDNPIVKGLENSANVIMKESTLLKEMVEVSKKIVAKQKLYGGNNPKNKRLININNDSPESFLYLCKASVDTQKMLNDITNLSRRRLTSMTIVPTAIIQNEIHKIKVEKNDVAEDIISTKTHEEVYSIPAITYKFIINDFLALPWLELLDIIKNKLPINSCEKCENYYFNAIKPEISKNCKVCGPPSRRPGRKPDDIRLRENLVRQIQRGSISLEEGNRALTQKGYKIYNPRK